jgi:hypothetical protein
MVVLVSVIAVVIISGCAIKHSDVMLFGTNTKYGLSIAMDQPENTPHINVGYKRQEFVWMPLVANGADSVIQNKVATANAQDLKYIGKEPTGKDDTYSVLASFGADFKASGAAGGGGIAQYFATGMAARKLAEVGGASLVQASNVDLTPKEDGLSDEQKNELERLINPSPDRIAIKNEYDGLVKKQLKPNFSYNNKTYGQDQTMQFANDYVAKEIDPISNADQIRATGTDEQLKKLIDALKLAVQ